MQHNIEEAVMEKRREHQERDGPNRVRKEMNMKQKDAQKMASSHKQPQADQAEADHEGYRTAERCEGPSEQVPDKTGAGC